MMHDLFAAIVAGACLFAIVSPRIPTGLLGSLGLGVVCVSALWCVDDYYDPIRANDLMLIGLGFLAAHVFTFTPRHRRRRAAHRAHREQL